MVICYALDVIDQKKPKILKKQSGKKDEGIEHDDEDSLVVYDKHTEYTIPVTE